MNRVLAHTGARYPIVQAAMGWTAGTRLASAVPRAGGLGIIEETVAQFFAITGRLGGLATEHKFG
jgi:NAD(P)H-dependent flavin oxidoreductase YrpB (nitropropane dioxygenase family)